LLERAGALGQGRKLVRSLRYLGNGWVIGRLLQIVVVGGVPLPLGKRPRVVDGIVRHRYAVLVVDLGNHHESESCHDQDDGDQVDRHIATQRAFHDGLPAMMIG